MKFVKISPLTANLFLNEVAGLIEPKN